MTLRNSVDSFSTIGIGFFGTLSPTCNEMNMDEEALNSYRVQTFSILKQQGTQAAHEELNRQVKQAPIMKNFSAYLMQEKNSNWIRGQLKCSNHEDAIRLVNNLKMVLPTGSMIVPPNIVTLGQHLPCESSERHYW